MKYIQKNEDALKAKAAQEIELNTSSSASVAPDVEA